MGEQAQPRAAIVTGAGPDIGRASALALARDGADLVLAARRAILMIEPPPVSAMHRAARPQSSLSTTTLLPKLSRYSSTKAAMLTLSKTMAREAGRDGVRVNVVTPGFTTGEGLDRLFEDVARRRGGDADSHKAQAAALAALGRHVDPEDIAEAVAFLASPRARNITGVELHVNAGQWIG